MFGDDDFAWLQGLRRTHYPADRNLVPAHLTLFHQLPPSAEGELSRLLAGASATPPPRATVTGILDLGEGTALRVESEELEAIRADLEGALFGLLTSQDRARWRPHVTIQNKVTAKEARALQSRLRGAFQSRPLRIQGLASWRYRGGPWEPIRAYPFRG